MLKHPPLEEMQVDLVDTKRDIEALTAIVENLDILINRTNEDRSAYKIDLFKYRVLLDEGLELKKVIQNAITQANN